MLSVSIFNVARYLTDSLRGPVLAHYSKADRPSLPRLELQFHEHHLGRIFILFITKSMSALLFVRFVKELSSITLWFEKAMLWTWCINKTLNISFSRSQGLIYIIHEIISFAETLAIQMMTLKFMVTEISL